jgi:hypothetical protein
VQPLSFVVPDVDAEDVLELAATEDDQPVEALAATAASPTCGTSGTHSCSPASSARPPPDLSISPQA